MRPPIADPRQYSPATARNRGPILEVLHTVLPRHARVLEVASGSGEHAVHFAGAMPGWEWQPSDPTSDALASIDAWRHHAALDNVRPPIALDVTRDHWPGGPFDAVVAINLCHIAPWEATASLVAGAADHLHPNGALILYGPFVRDGRQTAPSNEAFDQSLRRRDPRWGVRDLADVTEAAREHGFALDRVEEMPANNLTVVFRLQEMDS